MGKDDNIQGLRREHAYLSSQLEEASKELARLDLLNLTLNQQKRQAVAAFNFIRIMQEKIEEALTINDLYSNVVKGITSDLFMDSSAILKVNYKTRNITILALAGLSKSLKTLKLSKNISKQQLLEPTFSNSKSPLKAFHKFVINSFKFPYFVWYPIVDEKDATLVLFIGNRVEDLVKKQPFSDASLETFGAVSSVISLRRDNIFNIQEILRAKEERIGFLAEILKTCSISVIAMNENLKITYCNLATEKLYGYKLEELLGKDLSLLNAERNAAEIRRIILDTIRRGKVWKGEILNRKKNGDLFYVHVSVYKLLDKKGSFIALVNFQEDITERKRAEKTLQEAKELFEKTFTSQRDAIFILDVMIPPTILDCNPATTEVFGYTRQEMLGRATDFLHVDSKALKEFREQLYQAIAERGFLHLPDFHMKRKDGIVLPTEHSVMPLKDGQGNYIGWVSVVRDMTKRKQAEEALQKREKEIRLIADNIPALISYIGEDGYYRFVNKQYEEWFGIPKTDILGKHYRDIIGEATYELIKDRVEAVLSGNRVYYEAHIPYKHGGARWVDANYVPDTDDQGVVKGFYVLVTDISERKRTEDELRSSREQLRVFSARLSDAEEAERQRLAREMHDNVGQNLTALGINLNILRSTINREEVTDLVRSRLDDSLALVEQTTKYIRNVMTDLRPSVLDDYGLLAALRWYSQQFSDRTNVAVAIYGQGLIPRLPSVAETALFRITQEAFTNVVKHAQASQITLTLEEVAGLVRLTIVDDGKGFDSEVPSEKKGWGLIIIKERAEAIGGHFNLESEPGKGTRVMIEVRR